MICCKKRVRDFIKTERKKRPAAATIDETVCRNAQYTNAIVAERPISNEVFGGYMGEVVDDLLCFKVAHTGFHILQVGVVVWSGRENICLLYPL